MNKIKTNNKTLKGRFIRYQRDAKKRNFNFNISFENFTKITSNNCFYCGDFSEGKNYCGIDRVNSDLGYDITNCVSCCEQCNSMKLNWTVEEFLKKIEKIYIKHLKK